MKDHGLFPADAHSYHHPGRLIDQIGPCIKIVIDDIAGCSNKQGGKDQQRKRMAYWVKAMISRFGNLTRLNRDRSLFIIV